MDKRDTAALYKARAIVERMSPAALDEVLQLYRAHGHRPGFLDLVRAELREQGLCDCAARALVDAVRVRACL